MKTKLPQESESHENIIKEIAQIIKEKGERRIAYIILFGSFARGDWVDDFREESDGSWTTYNSDYDILVITKTTKSALNQEGLRLKEAIQKEAYKRNLLTSPITKSRSLSLILEPLKFINKNLRKGQYFLHEIKRDGIILYKAENVEELEEAKELSNEERREMSQEYFDEWFEYAEDFFKTYKFCLKETSYKLAAFCLHQAAENFLSCAHLVFTNYRPKTHNIGELIQLITPYCKTFRSIFLINNSEDKKHLDLLNAAYVGRYKKDYIIQKEELEYLVKKIDKLKEITKKTCQEKINSFT